MRKSENEKEKIMSLTSTSGKTAVGGAVEDKREVSSAATAASTSMGISYRERKREKYSQVNSVKSNERKNIGISNRVTESDKNVVE